MITGFGRRDKTQFPLIFLTTCKQGGKTYALAASKVALLAGQGASARPGSGSKAAPKFDAT